MILNDIIIKEFRKKHNLTQKELAGLVGVSWRTIQNYEKGNTIPESKYELFRNLITQYDNISEANEPISNYGLPDELTFDPVEDLRTQIYNLLEKVNYLEEIIKDKEEIITLLKDKLKEKK